MTELFNEKHHRIITNTNHFSVSLLIVSLFFIPKLTYKANETKIFPDETFPWKHEKKKIINSKVVGLSPDH